MGVVRVWIQSYTKKEQDSEWVLKNLGDGLS